MICIPFLTLSVCNFGRSSEPIVESQNDATGDDKSGGQILRHFFDDWPRRPLQQNENATGSNTKSKASTTSLSISISGNPSSDFSLKLSTGDGDGDGDVDIGDQAGNIGQERSQSNWAAQWGADHVSSVGGPLAEALRSSTSSSSPTSVLHQLQRGSASEASYVSS